MTDHKKRNVVATSRARQILAGTALATLLASILFALHHLVAEIRYEDMLAALQAVPWTSVLLAAVATAASYAALVGYDVSAVRFVGAKVPIRITVLASFCGYALGNTVGLGPLTGGAIRYRIYSAAGLKPDMIGRMVVFLSVAFAVGISCVAAVGLAFEAPAVAALLRVPLWALRLASTLVIVLAAAGLMLCTARGRARLRGRGIWGLTPPPVQLALMQLLFSFVDIWAASMVLWVLLPDSGVSLPAFVAIYTIGITLGTLSHVPGGLGVFEAVVLLAFGGRAPVEGIAAALLLYRAIYHLLPLFSATGLLALVEVRSAFAAPVARYGPGVARAAAGLLPLFVGTLSFAVGVMLLVSGATPAGAKSLDVLRHLVPLPVVEASHFISSLSGLALLVATPGLIRRLDGAWYFVFSLSGAAFVLAFTKGAAPSEIFILAFLLAVLGLTRHQFKRHASLLHESLTPGWIAAVACVVTAIVWLVLFVHRDVPYTHQLWWQFEMDAQAPRALRATLALIVASLALGITHLVRPAPGRVVPPTPDELDHVRAIVRGQARASANLALLGDKSFFFSASGDSFLMFSKYRRSWVSLFDPVGPREQWPELVWHFLDLVAHHGGRPAFYEISSESLPFCLEAGLRALKLGEEAVVDLPLFDMSSSAAKKLRYTRKRGAEKEGLTVELFEPQAVPPLLDELENISGEWLAHHNASEKGFSLGAFNRAYVTTQTVALVRQFGTPVAFATVMKTNIEQEAAIDLMRHRASASPYTMEFLFLEIILAMKTQGLQFFSLGMAPLAGLKVHASAPAWHHIGSLVWHHGEHFYNFQGLRAFKNKFNPRWEPRYLACPGGLHPLLTLVDIAMLTGHGLRGLLFAKNHPTI